MSNLTRLMHRDMTRKEFVATLGFGTATILGFGRLMQLLNETHTANKFAVLHGYGASSYGGPEDSPQRKVSYRQPKPISG